MRHQLTFDCEGATLAASLDEAPGTTGLLIVSGGNEIRSGAHRGMALLAQRVAAELVARALGRAKGITRALARDVLLSLARRS